MSNLKESVQNYLNFIKEPTGDHRDYDYNLDELQSRIFEAAVEQEFGQDIWQDLLVSRRLPGELCG